MMKPYCIIKRMIDIIISALALMILSPLFLVTVFLVKFSSKGPIFYTEPRLGKNKKPFTVYKFRTMVVGAKRLEKKGIPSKDLVTKVGKYLRISHLDEIPQFINILKGDMSFSGPRPIDNYILDRLLHEHREWNSIFGVKPGVTGLESIASYYIEKKDDILKDIPVKIEDPFPSLDNRLKLDSYYVNHKTLGLDLKIIYYTFRLFVKRTLGINH